MAIFSFGIYVLKIFSLLIASRYYISSLSLIINMLFTFSITVTEDNAISITKMSYLCFGLLIITTVYLNDSNERKMFLKEKENVNWESSIENAMRISLLQCSYNEYQTKVTFIKSNNLARKTLKLIDQNDFTSFIRKALLTTTDATYCEIK